MRVLCGLLSILIILATFMKSKITNFYIFIFFIFLIFNCFLVAVLSVYSGSLWTEVYKWFQFAILSLVLFYVFYKLNRFFGFIFLFFCHWVSFKFCIFKNVF